MPIPSTAVFGLISLDIVGPLSRTESGNKYILTCMDYLTRYPECIPILDITTRTVAKAFVTNIILRFGTPRSLLTDMGSQFMSELFVNICELLQIKKLHTTAYRPATNRVVERMHSVLKTMISHYVSEERYNWDEVLPYCLCAYRNLVHESTGETAFFLMFLRNQELPIHLITNDHPVKYDIETNYTTEMLARMKQAHSKARTALRLTTSKRCEKFNKKTKKRDFKESDRVYLSVPVNLTTNLAAKLKPKYKGPYRIVQQIGPVNFKIQEIGSSIYRK